MPGLQVRDRLVTVVTLLASPIFDRGKLIRATEKSLLLPGFTQYSNSGDLHPMLTLGLYEVRKARSLLDLHKTIHLQTLAPAPNPNSLVSFPSPRGGTPRLHHHPFGSIDSTSDPVVLPTWESLSPCEQVSPWVRGVLGPLDLYSPQAN